jgi:uncharacterized membrane protein required for colicin V production
MIFGFKNGLLLSVVRIGGWIAAIAAAFFTHNFVEKFLLNHTSIYDKLHDHVLKVCLSFFDKHSIDVSDPGSFAVAPESTGSSFTNDLAEQISKSAFTIFVFVAILLFVKFILFAIILVLSKKHHTGFIGGVDGVLGLIFGVVQGVIIVLVLLALLMPLSLVISPEANIMITQGLENSFVAEIIYNNNPLLSVINGLLPTDFNPANWLKEDSGGFKIPDLKDMI